MSSMYCTVSLELSPHLMQAAQLEAARRNMNLEDMISRYLATFLPENIDRGLVEYDSQQESEE